MAPVAAYEKDDKVLCFHGDLLYEAKVLKVKMPDPKDKKSPPLYFVHYKGWKNTWDDWVPQDQMRQLTEDNKRLAKSLSDEARTLQRARHTSKTQKKRNEGSFRGSEERHSSVAGATAMRGHKRGLNEREIEDFNNYVRRDQIPPIPMADVLKSILVDDWENVTKYMQIMTLPVNVTVRIIMQRYAEFERANRAEGSYERDVLEEIVSGIIKYFDKCLPRMLLYTLEKEQYAGIYKRVMNPVDDWANMSMSDIYGAQHLLRLITIMPELIAHTTLDEIGVNRLREELTRITQWMAHPQVAKSLFTNGYENTVVDPENARNGGPGTLPHVQMTSGRILS